jgi:protein-disulfide isomerase
LTAQDASNKKLGMRHAPARSLMMAAIFGIISSLLAGASCSKTSKGDPAPPPPPPAAAASSPAGTVGAQNAGAVAQAKPVVRPAGKVEPLPGVDVTDLAPENRDQFFRLVDSAASPCGKAQSLRAALKDPTCKRAKFAGNYLKKLAGFGAEDSEVLEYYKHRYEAAAPVTFDLSKAPYEGTPAAKIKIVEFFDYGCPHCKLTMPMLEDVVAQHPGQVVVYYLHYPLKMHGQSIPAATAAIAAQRQKKFREMHHKLFALQGNQSDEEIRKAAKELKLDMKRFEADWKDPAVRAQVDADMKQGDAVKLDGTPTIYIDGKLYTDPPDADWIKSWIAEELEVNR